MKLKQILKNEYKTLREVEDIESKKVKRDIVKAAQDVYDDWDEEDETMNGGGICHEIASAIVSVLDSYDIESTTVSQSVGEVHVFVAAKTDEGVFIVDIPPHIYEEGSGYSWSKIPNVKFEEDDVVIDMMSDDPEDFEKEYGDDI